MMFFILVVFSFVSCALSDNVILSTYVALNIMPRCGMELLVVDPSYATPSPSYSLDEIPLNFSTIDFPSYHHVTSEEHDARRYLVTWPDPENGTKIKFYPFFDPRMHSSHGHVSKLQSTSMVFYVPSLVQTITVYCRSKHHAYQFSLTEKFMHHRYRTLQSTGIRTFDIQKAGPVTSQVSLVFLSSGYLDADQKKFENDATNVFTYMNNPVFDRSKNDFVKNIFLQETHPLSRYAPFLNVFGVFQPSNQEGASVDGGATVDNNLQCMWPSDPTSTGLKCDMNLAVALAQASNAQAKTYKNRTAIVVLVNTKRYGGTGLYLPDTRLGVFSNYLLYRSTDPTTQKVDSVQKAEDAAKMTSLVLHELGHAYTNLMDEYDIGRSESKNIVKANCAMSSDASKSPWSHWIMSENSVQVKDSIDTLNKSLGSYYVSQQSFPVCGYSNYYRGSPKCMMRTLTDYYLCPVCREAATLKVLEIPPAFTWPQCPLKDQLVMIPSSRTEPFYFFLNSALTQERDFEVTWSGGVLDSLLLPCSANQGADKSCRRLASFPAGSYTITVTLSHKSKWIIKYPITAPWRETTTTFSINIYDGSSLPNAPGYSTNVSSSTCYNLPLTSSSKFIVSKDLHTYSYRCASSPSAVCEVTFSAPKYEAPNTGVQLEEAAKTMFYIVIGIAVLCFLLWVWALLRYSGRHVARPIFRTNHHGLMRIVVIIMTATAVILMLLSVIVLGAALYQYDKMGPFGQILLGVACMLAFALYILAFVGYWAVQNRSRKHIVVNGILLLLALGLSSALFSGVYQMQQGIKEDQQTWYDFIQEVWQKMVSDEPVYACQVELYLQCTGFNYTCDDVKAAAEDCPLCLDAVGKPWVPCKNRIARFIDENYTTIFYSALSVVVSTVFAVIFNILLYLEVRWMKQEMAEKTRQILTRAGSHKASGASISQALILLKSLSVKEKHDLVRQFQKIDRDHSGTLSPVELHVFLRTTLGYDAPKAEIEYIFRLLDLDRDGTLSMKEFFSLFVDVAPQGLDVPLAKREQVRAVRRRLDEECAAHGIVTTDL